MRDVIKSGHFEALRLNNADLIALTRLCLRCTDFFELVEGQPASHATVAEILAPAEGDHARGVKHVWGVKSGDEVLAVAELLEGYPGDGDWYIGLLLIDPAHRRKGIGTAFSAAVLDWIIDQGGTTVRLVVQEQNPEAASFWMRQGFALERQARQTLGIRTNRVSVLVRSVRRQPAVNASMPGDA